MATVYLHIGAPKTATSTLQRVMANNYKRLLKAGVLYPRTILNGSAHHALVCDLVKKHRGQTMPAIWYGDVPRGQAWTRLSGEIAEHGDNIRSVILSSELFFGQVHELTTMLKDAAQQLQGHTFKVIVYLRRQDQLYSSFYNQDVKGIRHWSQTAYQFYQTHQIFELGYPAVLAMWSEVFGRENIIVRPFEAEQWPQESIVKDFCQAIGGVSLRGSTIENDVSLGMVQLYVKRCLNRIGFDKALNEDVLKILYTICPEEPARGCLYVNRTLYTRYRAKWLEENAIISSTYLGGKDLFAQPLPEAKSLKVYEIDRFGAALCVRNMYEHFKKGRHRAFRQLFAKAMMLLLAEQNLWNALDADARAVLLEWATIIEN